MNHYYQYNLHDLDEAEAYMEHQLVLLREARRELINRTNANKPQNSVDTEKDSD